MVEKRDQRILAAREMRTQPTLAEKFLWEELRDRRLAGLRFKRQCVLGTLIADFYCPAAKLVIEVDGDIHDVQKEYDEIRTRQIKEHGGWVIRFRNEMVLNKINEVLAEIRLVAMERIAVHSSSAERKEEPAIISNQTDLIPLPSPDSRRRGQEPHAPDLWREENTPQSSPNTGRGESSPGLKLGEGEGVGVQTLSQQLPDSLPRKASQKEFVRDSEDEAQITLLKKPCIVKAGG